ncbi:50S ribosomal protein L32 [Mycoplasma haemocanis str. Illinois]|uniref:Large ribosomal subunit protein bL32 n=1 Tax=Mycoplasma haemocanis (strain Illinois) TaxID=1111676 RepID=H6N5I0_MYCHN|nr:50S ribosomal protein L32 [Mycoplasma haemocanis str. Illinois]
MAVSPRRVSKSRKGMRNSHSALKTTSLVVCHNCSRHIKSHSVCECGYYKGRQIIKK